MLIINHHARTHRVTVIMLSMFESTVFVADSVNYPKTFLDLICLKISVDMTSRNTVFHAGTIKIADKALSSRNHG